MMIRWPSIVILVALIFSGFASEGALATKANELFWQGLENCRSGQFAKAEEAFRDSLAKQPASGTLVNLGIAQWQTGSPGPAILSWEQASWIDPADRTARDNLRYAREIAQLDSPSLTWYEAASTWLPASAWAWLACGSFWLAVGMITLPIAFRLRTSTTCQALAALGLAVFLLSVPAHIGIVTRSHLGFVMERNVALRLTPTQEGEAVSTLTAGEPARMVRSRGDYFFIRTQTGSGWVQREQFGLVCPLAK